LTRGDLATDPSWHNGPMTKPTISLTDLRAKMEQDLTQNILPFWAQRGFNPDTGGLVGVVTNDLRVYHDVPQHSVLGARVLWTFAEAARLVPDPKWIEAGKRALALINGPFWDPENGGVYWNLNPDGSALSDRKQVYAQAFTIYGLVAWYNATGDKAALERAKDLFRLLEKHARDRKLGGYVEALSRSWGQLEDMRLSEKDLNSPKSYNTLLHVLEAYTVLLRAWPSAEIRDALKELLTICLDKLVYADPFWHCELFFDMEWRSLISKISYGHDIEASWLFWEAAVALGDESLKARTKRVALDLADAVLAHGLDADGAVMYDGNAAGPMNTDKHWWPQAEAVVGFLNAHQISGKQEYLDAALRAWEFIDAKVIDHVHGEWFALLNRSGQVLPDYPAHPESHKIGPWKCPYHNARACMEVIRRVPEK